METVYVITHPEATHHVENLVGGWYDSELTERGHRQAEQIARHLREVIPADVTAQLVTSDLRRTSQTADAIAQVFGIEPEVNADLREKSYGAAEGKPQAWLDERFVFPPAYPATPNERMDHDEGIPGAETKLQWVQRTYRAVAQIEETAASHRIIVTHGGTANWVIAAWQRIPVEGCGYVGWRLAQGSITTLSDANPFHNRTLLSLGVIP